MVAFQTGDLHIQVTCELMFVPKIFITLTRACSFFQVWEAVCSDLVVPSAGHTGMQRCPFSIVLGLLHFKVFLWNGCVWNHH